MPDNPSNKDISRILQEDAELVEQKGGNEFRVRSYRKAARTVEGLPREAGDLLAEGADLSGYEGIGDSIAAKIREILDSGKLQQLEDLRQEMPEGLTDLLELRGVGPETVSTLHQELGIASLPELKDAAEDGRIHALEGFGRKTEQNILDALKALQENAERGRLRLDQAQEHADRLIHYMGQGPETAEIQIAGSLRRGRETIGDLDVLVATDTPEELMDHFTGYPKVLRIESKGETRSTVTLRDGLQVDLRVVEESAFGAGLLYFTGSKDHNIALRRRAQERDIKISEYGAFSGDERVAGRTEEEIYKLLDLPCIPTELRENTGELEAAEKNQLPELVTRDDIRGDLHSHTNASDGKFSLKDMADAARELGHEYLAITDHSRSLRIANGLSADDLPGHLDEIRALDDRLEDIRLFAGSEVDILEDGSLDYDDRLLSRMDFVLASIHTGFQLSRRKQTERMLRAIRHPLVSVIAHPTGRRLGKREAYDIDMGRVIEACAREKVALEINANPERLDMKPVYAREARDAGVKIVVSTDAHAPANLDYMRWGVSTARRAWLRAEDIVNTGSASHVMKTLSRGR